MAIDFSRIGYLSRLKYGESLSKPVCVSSFEKPLPEGKLIEFGDLASPAVNRIEQLSTRQYSTDKW